jgi:hypothetical protein
MVFRENPEIYYGEDQSVLIILDGQKLIVGAGEIVSGPPAEKLTDLISICNLSDLEGSSGPIPDWGNMPDHKLAIDPVLGRIAFPPSSPIQPIDVKVDYYYGFSAELGGGGYKRGESFSAGLLPVVKVPEDAPTIKDALGILANNSGTIEITNSDYHKVTPVLDVPADSKLEIRAAETCRPILILDEGLNITGGQNSEISFHGLLCCGGTMNVISEVGIDRPNQLHAIHITHCTLVPGRTPFDLDNSVPANPRLIVASADTVVNVNRSIIGGMRVSDTATAKIIDSILDCGDKTSTAFSGLLNAAEGGALIIENSTVIGKVKTIIMTLASNTIFYAEAGPGDSDTLVTAKRLQEGCVRFSYIPIPSRVPKPYRCQPATEADAPRVKPMFASLRYGDAHYCQLDLHTVDEIRLGAENEMEMGAFYHLYQPLREYNLRTRLDEYLRFGLEAGIYYGS